MNYQRFPFGKYKGYSLSEIPLNYIVYALTEMDLPDELIDSLKDIVVDQLDLSSNMEYVELKIIYKQLAFKYHPDKGGSVEAMQIINEFYNLLK